MREIVAVVVACFVVGCGGAIAREDERSAQAAPSPPPSAHVSSDAGAVDATAPDAATTPNDDAGARPPKPQASTCDATTAAAAAADPCSCTTRLDVCQASAPDRDAVCGFESTCEGAPFHPLACGPYRSFRIGGRDDCEAIDGGSVCCFNP